MRVLALGSAAVILLTSAAMAQGPQGQPPPAQAINVSLVYAALGVVALAFVGAAIIMWNTEAERNLEILKARFAQVTFVGILVLVIFTSLLYVADPAGAGKDIFEKALTALTPLAGAIIGYYFAGRPRESSSTTIPPAPSNAADPPQRPD
jgi:hypothetical protein